MIIKHLYQRSVKKNGKSIKAWYFWYYDSNGKQVRKSCGHNGKMCLLKREAEAFIANLKDEDLLGTKEVYNFNDVAQNFYADDSFYLKKLSHENKKNHKTTIYCKKHYLGKFLDRFGTYNINNLNEYEIIEWLYTLDYSGSVKNQILSTIRAVYESLYMRKLINRMPLFKAVSYNPKNKGILTKEEINKLFPSENYEEIVRIWKIRTTYKFPEYFNYIYAAMIYLILSTGMRSGEVRALTKEQFLENNIIYLNAMIDSSKNRVDHLKKGTDDNKKWRVVYLPEKTKRFLEKAIQLYPEKHTPYIFELKGESVTSQFLNERFKKVLQKNGIDTVQRNISIHSLRYMYNTTLRRIVPDENIRLMLGHDTEGMTDYYDKSTALENIPMLINNANLLNEIWK